MRLVTVSLILMSAMALAPASAGAADDAGPAVRVTVDGGRVTF